MTPRRRWFAKARRPRVPGQMNRLETAYADHLTTLKAAGKILAWWYERYTLKLADDTRYTPDFAVLTPDCELEFHETKGVPFRDDAKVKLTVAAEYFPHRFLLVRQDKATKGWTFEEFASGSEERAA